MDGSPLLIWGAGAIGGTVGAYWRRAGHEVLFVDRDMWPRSTRVVLP
jgi:2-dehydropantoate 2-reductase